MSNQLRIFAYWGLFLTACDSDPVNPVQIGSRSMTAGGSTNAMGGTPTGGSGVVTGGSVTVGGASGSTTIITSTGGSAKGGASTSGGTSSGGTGVGGSTEYATCKIKPTPDTGWVAAASNDCGIQGAWYAYSDCDTSPTDCTLNQVPQPNNPVGFPNEDGKMCTSGMTVPLNNDYTNKWGAGIALNLNQPAEPANNEIKNPISELPHALKGFRFNLTGTVPNPLRVIFPTKTTTASTAHFKVITGSGTYQVLFSEAAQGSWVTEASEQVALVPGDIVEVQFQVVAQKSTNVQFDFCVEELTALY